MPAAYHELERIRKVLETHFTDMQDFEFTIQDKQVFMLQTRNGKRTGVAAVRIACEMVKEKLIDWQTAVTRVPADQLDQVLARSSTAPRSLPPRPSRPACPPARRGHGQGLLQRRPRGRGPPPRREGVARPHRDLARGSAWHDRRRGHPHGPRRCFVPRRARGRQMGKVCVCGAAALQIDYDKPALTVGTTVVREGNTSRSTAPPAPSTSASSRPRPPRSSRGSSRAAPRQRRAGPTRTSRNS